MEFIKPFWDEYGKSIIMLLAHGVLIGIVIEFAVKKMFDTMIEKAEGTKKEKITRAKAIGGAFAGAFLSFLATVAVVKSMPLPGGAYFYAFWCTLIYMVQYLVSLYGIKFIQKKFNAPKKEKVQKPKKRSVTIEEGQHLFKRLDDGSIVEL